MSRQLLKSGDSVRWASAQELRLSASSKVMQPIDFDATPTVLLPVTPVYEHSRGRAVFAFYHRPNRSEKGNVWTPMVQEPPPMDDAHHAILSAHCLARIRNETFVADGEYHTRLTSTNDRARQLASEGGALPQLVIAEQQSAGRGRGKNRWWTGQGSLALSLLLDRPQRDVAVEVNPLISLAAAVAVVEAIRPLARPHQVGLHWPNDVFLEGRKLAGMLVEVLPDRRSIVGIGVNTNSTMSEAPAELQSVATTLRDVTGRLHDQTDVLIAILNHLARQLQQLDEVPESIGRAADEMCLQKGRRVTVSFMDQHPDGQRLRGTCRGIDPDGALVVEADGQIRHIYSGVVEQER